MDQVAQIKEKIDIVSFIGEFISLKKAGRNFSAPCPFHQEKTPSFMVSPERQSYHCFGCNKSGDVYTFLMDYERLEFPEALRILAKRAGITLSVSHTASVTTSQKERMYQMNSLAKEFYHYILTKHKAGKAALTYLQKRGITKKLIETFSLGYAPSSGNALTKYLMQKKGYSKEDLVDSGLAFLGRSGTVDFFRGRLMFPLIDYRDNVLGFSGRVMDGQVTSSKYINTRETLIYHKGEHVYGLNVTKDALRRENQVIIVEGEFDVMSCFEHGIGNVVAVKGTALTEQQVNLISRYVSKITFCFDDDKAGREAIKRNLSIVERKSLTASVIVIPNGKDPDESLQKEEGGFKKAVKEDMGVYDYLFMRVFSSYDTANAQGKKQATDELLPFIAQIQNEIIKEHYLRKLSGEIEISYESIVKEMQRYLTKATAAQVPVVPQVKQKKEESREEYLLALIVQSEKSKELLMKSMDILSGTIPNETATQKVIYILESYFKNHSHLDRKQFGQQLDKSLSDCFTIACLYPITEFDNQDKQIIEVEKISHKLMLFYIQQRMKQIAQEIKLKVAENKNTEVEKLEAQYSSLATKLA